MKLDIDLDEFAPALLNFLANRLSSTGTAAYSRAFGIGYTEFQVMVMLANEPDIPAVRIVEVIDLDKGAVSRTLKALVRRALIIPSLPPPRRRPLYRLSAEGERIHAGSRTLGLRRAELLLDGLDSQQKKQLTMMLRLMLNNIAKLQDLARRQGQRGTTVKGASRAAPIRKRKRPARRG